MVVALQNLKDNADVAKKGEKLKAFDLRSNDGFEIYDDDYDELESGHVWTYMSVRRCIVEHKRFLSFQPFWACN